MKEAKTETVPPAVPLGLSLPMFLGSLIALFSGIFPGIVGVWLFAAWKIAVPEFIKAGHAHASWWSVLILLTAFFLPAVPLKPRVKKFVAYTGMVAVPFWIGTLAAYYVSKEARGVVAALPPRPGEEYSLEYLVYGTGIFVIEVWFFATLALVLLSAMGVRFPRAVFTLTYRLGLVGLPLLVAGWILFNLLRLGHGAGGEVPAGAGEPPPQSRVMEPRGAFLAAHAAALWRHDRPDSGEADPDLSRRHHHSAGAAVQRLWANRRLGEPARRDRRHVVCRAPAEVLQRLHPGVDHPGDAPASAEIRCSRLRDARVRDGSTARDPITRKSVVPVARVRRAGQQDRPARVTGGAAGEPGRISGRGPARNAYYNATAQGIKVESLQFNLRGDLDLRGTPRVRIGASPGSPTHGNRGVRPLGRA